MQQNLFLSLFFLLLLRDCSADQVSSSSFFSISSKSFSRALLHMKLRLQCLKHLLKIPHRLQQPQRPPHHPPMIALGELFFSLSSFAGRGLFILFNSWLISQKCLFIYRMSTGWAIVMSLAVLGLAAGCAWAILPGILNIKVGGSSAPISQYTFV